MEIEEFNNSIVDGIDVYEIHLKSEKILGGLLKFRKEIPPGLSLQDHRTYKRQLIDFKPTFEVEVYQYLDNDNKLDLFPKERLKVDVLSINMIPPDLVSDLYMKSPFFSE